MVFHYDEAGITQRFMTELLMLCKKNESIESIMLFGSRARGDYRNTSDIDLALFTNHLSHSEQNLIEADLQNLPTPLKIDVLFMNRLAKEKLLVNIRNEGVVLYEKGKTPREA
ncbi:nucleotidyltransferase domain-containing protein [Sporosarcina sp. YIM B06819]|uniref:nucleotidyltransferase domain-containing protein n=1 Tax=Sporosarcina sp. YIM B06819 TaxID=3081769 RepID=UPI00298C7678|nr:nucleotidyltransferase domain-containing protein [Sporosarcina sp. YIM B06819]